MLKIKAASLDPTASSDAAITAPPYKRLTNGIAAGASPDAISDVAPGERYSEAWWSARSHQELDDKNLMAQYFVAHHFLVPLGRSCEGPRETVASILVNQGTTPNSIVKKALQWIFAHKKKGQPYFMTWYTPGHVVPTTLSEFRELDSPEKGLSSALKLFLFPGDVDEETQSVLGEHAVNFVKQFPRNFRYSLLSAYSFDLATGDVKFHFPKEIALQEVLATRWADHKYLFLQPSKFKPEGETAYRLRDMLDTSRSVTIYTVHSAIDDKIVAGVQKLAKKMKLKECESGISTLEASDTKLLRLQIVGRDDAPSTSHEYRR
jgi:hypothetical protein